MGWLARLTRGTGAAPAAAAIAVRLVLKGRIGEGWYDVDRSLALPAGATLRALLDEAERRGIAVRAAIAQSPHLGHTLMWNGDRCAVEDHLERPLADGDEIYLLAPLAGG